MPQNPHVSTLHVAKLEYEGLSVSDKIEFLTWVFKTDPHKYDYATMSEPLQRFHNPDAKREA